MPNQYCCTSAVNYNCRSYCSWASPPPSEVEGKRKIDCNQIYCMWLFWMLSGYKRPNSCKCICSLSVTESPIQSCWRLNSCNCIVPSRVIPPLVELCTWNLLIGKTSNINRLFKSTCTIIYSTSPLSTSRLNVFPWYSLFFFFASHDILTQSSSVSMPSSFSQKIDFPFMALTELRKLFFFPHDTFFHSLWRIN